MVRRRKKVIDVQAELIRKLSGRWPYRLRVPMRDKRGPFLIRGKALTYQQVSEATFYSLRQRKKIIKTLTVRTSEYNYDEYELKGNR